MRLIDADALKAIRFHDLPYSQIVPTDCDTDEKVSAYKLGWNDAIDAIVESVPTVDPIKHGHWIIRDIPGTYFYKITCSECSEDVTSSAPCIGFLPNAKVLWDYCPYCGAKMDEVEKDGDT